MYLNDQTLEKFDWTIENLDNGIINEWIIKRDISQKNCRDMEDSFIFCKNVDEILVYESVGYVRVLMLLVFHKQRQ